MAASRGCRAHPVVRGRCGRSRKDHRQRAPRPDRGRPGRGVRLPGREHPGVAAARLGLPARLPVLRRLGRPVHQAGPRQPGHPVLPLLPARRRRVRGHRPPRHHDRPELPGARRRLLPGRGAGQPERVRRPGDRDRRRRDVRAAVRPRQPRRAGAQPLPARPGCGDAARPRGLQRLGCRAAGHHRHPPRRPRRLRAAGAGHRGDRQALPGGREDPAVPAPDLPRLPRVVLPEAAGKHDDRAAPDARRPHLPVVLGRPLRPRRRPGDDRDRPGRRPGRRALSGDPTRQHVVRLAGLHQSPDQPHRRPGAHRPGRQATVRDQRARPGRRQLAGVHRAPARLRADPLAAAVPGPRARGRAAGRGGRLRRPSGPPAVLPAGAGDARGLRGEDRRPPGRRRRRMLG